MNQAGFNVITGEIGTGKTTLLRHLLAQMGADVTVGLISNTHRSFGELLQWILFAFNLEYRGKEKVEMFHTFLDFIVKQYSQNKRTILIVDEAQNMPAETLEELRMLSNVNADKDQVLQVILVGQAQLRDTLRRPDMEQFAQRIAVDYHLDPLGQEETRIYIRHRIQVAGGRDANLFDDAACNAVYLYSNGVPRLINLLCDTALVYGFAEHKVRIDAKMIVDVAKDKQKGGIFPGPEKTRQGELSEPDHAIIAEFTHQIEQERVAHSNGEDAASVQKITQNEIGLLNYLKRTHFKTVDVEVIKYLKRAHTDLYTKLRMAVRSYQKRNS